MQSDSFMATLTALRVDERKPGVETPARGGGQAVTDERARDEQEQAGDAPRETGRPARRDSALRNNPALRDDTPLSKEQVVARLFEAFSRRDLPSVFALMHPEIVFQPMTATVTQGGEPYRGHEGMLRYAQDIESHWDELTINPTQIRAAGRAVVALGVVSGRGAGGSFRDAPTTWVVKFREGLVAHVQIFSDERYVVGALSSEDL